MPAPASSKSIVLEIKGLTIPAFKNRKRAIRDRRTGKQRTLTEPRVKEQMERIILAIGFQLLSVIPTTAGETLTAQQARSWIASSLPSDDSRQIISQIFITALDCDKGEEGAQIIIEKMK